LAENNVGFSDVDSENAANDSNDFVDFNALNANNFSDDDQEAEYKEENEDFPHRNSVDFDEEEGNIGNNSEDEVGDYSKRNSLQNNTEAINTNNNTNPNNILLNSALEKEKENLQKSHTNKTNKSNTNRTLLDKENKNSGRQQNNTENNNNKDNNHLNKINNTEEEENETQKAEKQGIISLLMNTEIKPKAAAQKREESLERKQKTANAMNNKSKKFQHIESKYKKEILENDPIYKAGPEKFFINMDLNNPEFKADKQHVQRKLLLSTKKALESEKEKIIRRLLFQDIEKQKKIVDVNKLSITNNEIKSKVSYYLNKKQKNLDEIESLKDQMLMKNCTFQPEIVAEKLFPDKREFKAFLEDQKNHLKRVYDKMEKVN